MSARRAVAWLVLGSAALTLHCAPGGTRPTTVATVPVDPAAGGKPEVDPIPIDIAALERIVSSAPAGSERSRRASERLDALLSLTPSTKARAPSRAGLIGLARAYERAGDLPRAQQIWRNVACPELHAYPVPVDENGADRLVSLPQDHDDRFWSGWYHKHPVPLDTAKPGHGAVSDPAAELSYRPIFAAGCAAPDAAGPGSEANHQRTRAWLAIATYYSDVPDAVAGPYAMHRGREAWLRAREFAEASGDAELTAAALLGLADIHFRMQRYRASVLAAHTALEAIEKLVSPALRDALSQRPVHVIASSLSYVDFEGPPPEDPFIPRSDTLDLETDPFVAERKMHVGVERLRDPALVPPNRRWTAAVYVALMDEYESLAQQRNLVDTARAFAAAFPNHPLAPVVLHRIARAWSSLSRYAPDSSRDKVKFLDAYEAALAELLKSYGPDSSWAKANSRDAKARARAATIVEQARTELERSRTLRAKAQPQR